MSYLPAFILHNDLMHPLFDLLQKRCSEFMLKVYLCRLRLYLSPKGGTPVFRQAFKVNAFFYLLQQYGLSRTGSTAKYNRRKS